MKINKSLKLLFFLSFLTFSLLISLPVKSESALYDQWSMKKEITINNQNNSDNLHNYQLLLNISYEPEMQDDFEDIRFSYYNSSSGSEIEIPYFIERYENATYADVWIKIPYIEANSYGIILIYYGNNGVHSISNGSCVFDFFDNFEKYNSTDEMKTNVWSDESQFGAEILLSKDKGINISNCLELFCDETYESAIAMAVRKINISINSTIEFNLRQTHNKITHSEHGFGEGISEAEPSPGGGLDKSNNKVSLGNSWGTDVDYLLNKKLNLESLVQTFSNIDRTLYRKYKIIWKYNETELYIDNVLQAKNNENIPEINLYIQFGFRCNWGSASVGDVSTYIDNIFIHRFMKNFFSYSIGPAQPNIQCPEPTNRSLIITNDDWKNVLASVPTRVPLLVAEGMNDHVRNYLEDFDPDYIYTMGFDAGLNNSFEINYDQVPSLFFPEAGEAVLAGDRERGIIASQLAYYEGMPVIFDPDQSVHFSEVLNLSNFTLEDIRDLYLDRVVGNGGNIDYLIITNPDFNESLLAGYLSGIRRGFVILIDNRSFESINRSINDAIDRLSGMGLFSSHVNYIKGDPLYLAIMGGNESVPFVYFLDTGFEVLNDKDGFLIHSDVWYADVDGDGFFELAPGRIAGDIGSVSLQLSGLMLPRRGNATLIGEYRHSMFVDLFHLYGGMPQAFTGDLILKNAGMETERIVEGRIEIPELSAYNIVRNVVISVGEDAILYLAMGKFAAVVNALEKITTIFYTLFEFDILEWVSGGSGYIPDHLPVIGENLNEMTGDTEILAYFGLGDNCWLIPPANRSKWDLILWPYRDSTGLTEVNHSRFLYADHDMSSESGITMDVLERGGSALASSGIIHDPYSLHSSVCFIEGISSGKSVGSSLLETLNFNALDYALTKVGLNPMDKYGDGIYWKNKLERILFSDPAYRPVEGAYRDEAFEYTVRPSESFLIESEITGDYVIQNRAVVFKNADSYLTRREKPIIPVFAREFMLPGGSVIKSVDFEGTYSNKFGMKMDLAYNDSHYTNYSGLVLKCVDDLGLVTGQELTGNQETRLARCIKETAEPGFEYPFPETDYWYRSNELMDGRVLVTVIVPGVLYRNSFAAEVLERGRINLDYETPYEMSVDVNDTVLGENASIKVHLYNEGSPLNGTLFVWVQDTSVNFTENVLIPEGGIVKTFEFLPESEGLYKVIAVFTSDVPMGPRAKSFEVGKMDIGISKEFHPDPIRKRSLRFIPVLPNKPRITVENLGGIGIKSVRVDDEIPQGFRINNWGRWIPLFIYLKRDGGMWRFDMLGRNDYDYRIEDGHLIVEIPDLESTRSGKCLENGDKLIMDYIMSTVSLPETQDVKTKVTVTTPNGMFLEREITEELKVV